MFGEKLDILTVVLISGVCIDFSKKFDIKFVYELNWFRRSQIGFHNRRDLCVLYCT